MAVEWKQIKEPESYSKEDIYAYFGIPPSPESELEKNIKRKRQFWHKRASGVGNREESNRIKKWIQQLSKILEDGEFPDEPVVHSESGTFTVLGEPQTPEELAEQLEALLRQGNVQDVLDLVSLALNKWPENEDVLLYVALALSEIVRDYGLNSENSALADRYTAEAAQQLPTNASAWLARARFAYANGNVQEIQGLEGQIAARGVELPGEVLGILANTAFDTKDEERGIGYLVQQVEATGGDPGARSVAVDILLSRVIDPMLPLMDAKAAARFGEVVNVAAWLAEGVPETEAELVPYRMWAEESVGRVFTGDLAMKSFIGVLTGFLALPLYTRALSKPSWRVLRDGPQNRTSAHQWKDIAGNDSLEFIHRKGSAAFPWQESVQQPWPSAEEANQLVEQFGYVNDKGKPVKRK